jgi:parallel beta-helix repeat protein
LVHLRSWNNKINLNVLNTSVKNGIELDDTTENIITNNNLYSIGEFAIYLNEGSQDDDFINTLITTNIFKNINT